MLAAVQSGGLSRTPRARAARRASAVFGALLATLLASSPAWADARTEAQSHFKKGMEAIANGRYEVGIAELKRANENPPPPERRLQHRPRVRRVGRPPERGPLLPRVPRRRPAGPRRGLAEIVQNIEARIRRQQAAAAQAAAPSTAAVSTATGATTGAAAGAATPVTPGAPTNAGGAAASASVNPATTPGATPAETAASSVGAARTEDVFEESVVTASRGAQSPLDAPNSTSIVTEQDIRLSGITKIPELLRRLAGVDIMEVTGAQTEVSLRGFNQRLSNKVLVLVDGRSVYIDLLGATIWATLSIAVEDIERIEVVRGPASALYGADAFNGVINIITKRPGDRRLRRERGLRRSRRHAREPLGLRARQGLRLARVGRLRLPAAVEPRGTPRPERPRPLASDQNESSRTTRLDLRGTEQVGKDVVIGLGGGLTQGDTEVLGIGPINDIDLTNFVNSDVTAYVNSPHLEARAFWNRTTAPFGLNAASIGQSLLAGTAALDVVDGDVQGVVKFETGKGIEHDLRAGVEYRYKGVDWTYIGNFHSENHESITAQDSVKLGRYVGLVANARVDYDPYLERFIGSPHGTLLVHPTKRSTIRGIVGTAFRTPTFLEEYLNLSQQLPVAGASFVEPPLPSNAALRSSRRASSRPSSAT